MTGSAFSSLDCIWQIRPAITVNSDNLRIIGPLLFVYKEWPLGERRLSMPGIDNILLYVLHRSVLQPEGCLEPGLSKTFASPLLRTWTAGLADDCRSSILQEDRR
jgi:hypothetical protein